MGHFNLKQDKFIKDVSQRKWSFQWSLSYVMLHGATDLIISGSISKTKRKKARLSTIHLPPHMFYKAYLSQSIVKQSVQSLVCVLSWLFMDYKGLELKMSLLAKTGAFTEM